MVCQRRLSELSRFLCHFQNYTDDFCACRQRAVIQRVLNASVTVEGSVVGSIGRGLCVLIGIHEDDTEADAEYIIRRLLNGRLWPDDKGKQWAKSATELDLEILMVSQFTLYGTFMKGTKPDFHVAMKGDLSRPFFDRIVQSLKSQYKEEKIQSMFALSLIVFGVLFLRILSTLLTCIECR